jgi:hypothetical protein
VEVKEWLSGKPHPAFLRDRFREYDMQIQQIMAKVEFIDVGAIRILVGKTFTLNPDRTVIDPNIKVLLLTIVS